MQVVSAYLLKQTQSNETPDPKKRLINEIVEIFHNARESGDPSSVIDHYYFIRSNEQCTVQIALYDYYTKQDENYPNGISRSEELNPYRMCRYKSSFDSATIDNRTKSTTVRYWQNAGDKTPSSISQWQTAALCNIHFLIKRQYPGTEGNYSSGREFKIFPTATSFLLSDICPYVYEDVDIYSRDESYIFCKLMKFPFISNIPHFEDSVGAAGWMSLAPLYMNGTKDDDDIREYLEENMIIP